jgi:hypothetical protein
MGQLLKRQCLTLCLRFRNQRLADAVVHIPLEARLAAGVLSQPPASTATVGLLQFPALLEAPVSDPLDRFAAIGCTVAIRSQVHNPKVDTQEAGRLIRCRVGLGLGDMQEELTVTLNQFRAADLPVGVFEGAALKRAQDQLPVHPSVQGVETDPIQTDQSIGVNIQADATLGSEGRTGLVSIGSCCSHRLSRLVPGATGQLRAKPVIGAGRAVDTVVEFVLIGNALVPGDLRAVGRRHIECLSRCSKRGSGIRIKRQLAADCACGERLCHEASIPQSERLCECRLKRAQAWRFLPPLKRAGGSAERHVSMRFFNQGRRVRAVGTAPSATRPLTGMNRARLIMDSVPVIFWIAMLIFVVFFLDDIVGQNQSLLLISLFVGLVVLVTGYQAIQRIRDLLSGVAVVEEDVLERSWQSRRSSHKFGVFAKLGRMSMTSQAFHQGQRGERYRVAYSPASKIVWSLEEVP